MAKRVLGVMPESSRSDIAGERKVVATNRQRMKLIRDLMGDGFQISFRIFVLTDFFQDFFQEFFSGILTEKIMDPYFFNGDTLW